MTDSLPTLTVSELRHWQWQDMHAFRLSGCDALQVDDCLRLLPGKRLVVSGRWGQQPAVVKLFFGKRHAELARTEADRLRALKQAGIAVPSLLAEQTGTDWSLLATAFVQGRALQAGNEDDLQRLVATVEKLYDAGFLQRDPHADNFLFDGDRLWCIDAGDLVPLAGDADKVVRDNLALLVVQMPLALMPRALELVRPLAHSRGVQDAQLDAAVDRACRRRIAKMLKKWSRASTAIGCFQRDDVAVFHDRTFWPSGPPDILFEGQFPGELLKDGNSAGVWRWQGLIIKQYRKNSWLTSFRRKFRLSRGWQSWLMGRTLLELGVPTARPLALVTGPGQEFIVQQELDGRVLWRVVHDQGEAGEKAADEARHLLRLLHQAGFIHGDCKAHNFFCTPDGVSLIDLDSMRWVPGSRRFRALAKKDKERLERGIADALSRSRPGA
jgi:tRNA A-37 threonylcarbamoyl transferase component Bud32